MSRITDKGDHWLLPAPGINYYVIKRMDMFIVMWMTKIGVDPYKTQQWIFKYPYNDDWLEHKFYPLWPETYEMNMRAVYEI